MPFAACRTKLFLWPLLWWWAIFASSALLVQSAKVGKKDTADSLISSRIVNGKAANIADFPFQVSLRHFNRHLCGAAVLTDRWAITAAHCFDGVAVKPARFTLHVGSERRSAGGTIVQIIDILIHPVFDKDTMNNDAALLLTAANRLRGSLVQPIRLPAIDEHVAAGTPLVVSGWGQQSATRDELPDLLMSTTVRVVAHERCSQDLQAYGEITETMLCAAATRTDACQGDSGGPLQHNGTLVGLVSWGVGCADPRYPGIYTRLAHPRVRLWIKVMTRL